MSSGRLPRRQVDQQGLLALARESEAVISLVTHDHNFWSYPPALYACCYAIIRIGEGVHRLDSPSRRRLRSASLAVWEEWRNALAHELDLVHHSAIFDLINGELPLLLRDLGQPGR